MSDAMPQVAEGVELSPAEQKRREMQNLGPFVYYGWEAARDHKQQCGVDEELDKCLRDRSGEYDASEKTNIKLRSGLDNPVFIPFTDLKARTAKTLILEVFLNSSDIPYTLAPTPVPDLEDAELQRLARETIESYKEWVALELQEKGIPPEEAEIIVEQTPPDPLALREFVNKRKTELDGKKHDEALYRAERMLKKMRDQQVEGRWHEAFMAAGDDATTYGTCIVMGPVRRMRRRTRWDSDTIKLEDVPVMEWEAISPLLAYPQRGAVEINDGDFFRVVRMTPAAFADMKQFGAEDGYFPAQIDTILATYPSGGLSLNLTNDTERRRMLNDTTAGTPVDAQLEGIEAWMNVRGSMLKQEGVTKDGDGKDIEDAKYYDVNAMVFDKRVVYASVLNPRLGRPLAKGVFYRKRGSWWGYGPMKAMRDPMRMYNAAARDLCVNMAFSSIPTRIVRDVTRVPAGTSLSGAPGGILYFNDPAMRGDKPVDWEIVPSNAPQILGVMDRLEKLFDTVTGIPALQHGSDVAAGAGRTYNGLLLIINASKQGANDVVLSLFNDVMKPMLEYQYRYNLLFDPDETIKGDCEVKAGGLLSILLREQTANKMIEFINMAQNPNVMKVIGEAGLSELLRQYLNLLPGINPDNVVPSKSEMERREKLAEIDAEMKRAEQAGMAMQNALGNPTVGAQTPSAGVTGMQAGSPSLNAPTVEQTPMIPMGPQVGMETPEQEAVV